MDIDAVGGELLRLARGAIGERFGASAPAASGSPALRAPGASFVTLTQAGRLRGCIGSLEAWRPLADDVCANAVAAAFADPRFAPLAAEELPATRVEVSLLTPAEPIVFAGEDELLASLRPGVDGVILECGGRRATFLPQVWQQLPEPRQFLAQLKRKAGLAPDFRCDPPVKLWRYGVRKWQEPEATKEA
jgi:uncharacterized protein